VQRYTRQLAAQEDRIDALTRERSRLQARRKAGQAELDALVDAPSLDVTMVGS